jgi:hypothetical protein
MIAFAIDEVLELVKQRGCLGCHASDNRNNFASICDANGFSCMSFLEILAQVVLQLFDAHVNHVYPLE